MALVDLSLLKKHVRADDFEDDDEYLASILEAAEAWVVESTARTEDELLELGGGSLPPQLRQAVLFVAGHWYNQREAVSSVSMSEVPYTVQALVKPFRRLVADTEGCGTGNPDTGNPEPDTATFTIVPDPENATVVIDGIERQSVTVEVGTEVSWSVAADGYYTRRGIVAVDEDSTLPVTLTEKDGVSVAYTDTDGVKRICAPSEWNEGLGEAQGVLVEDGEHSILVAPTESESLRSWDTARKRIDGVTTVTSSAAAKEDYEGKANTAFCVAGGIAETFAAGWCNAYAHGAIGAGGWWLPACGELCGLISPRISDIKEALTVIGGEDFADGTIYWTSTQESANIAWSVIIEEGSPLDLYNKTIGSHVRAVSEWDYEE